MGLSFAVTTLGNITLTISIPPSLHHGWKLYDNLASFETYPLDWFGLFLCHSFIASTIVGILFRRCPTEILDPVICFFKFSNMINLGLTLWVVIGNKRFSDEAMNLKKFTFSVFVKTNKQVTSTVFRWPQNLSSYQTLHSPPVARLVRPFITNDIPPNFNIFFQFLSDVAPEPYFSITHALARANS